MQRALVEVRCRDLERLEAKPGARLTLQEEQEAFSLALAEARRGEAGEALAVWARVVLHRHYLQINAVRLRWVELLTALTHGSDAPTAYTTSSLIRAIYAEHLLSGQERFPAEIVTRLAPLLAGRQTLGRHAAPCHPLLERAFAVMEARFGEGIGLREVAAAVHCTPEHLARVFRQETGQSVVAYLQRLRLDRARELLSTTSRPLLEVAFESGFESIEHFHRLFKRECGMTPRAYRKKVSIFG